MKRKLAVLLLAVLLMGCLSPSAFAGAPAPGTKRLRDVDREKWFYGAVNFCVDRELMVGTSATRFDPNRLMTRAMLVQILYRMDGCPWAPLAEFHDVADNTWYASAVGWAAANGIVNGVSQDSFAPKARITREQFATILYRYLRYKGHSLEAVSTGTFSDADVISSWAKEALEWAAATRLVQGYSDGTVRPKEGTTRSAAATMIARLYDNYLEPGCVDWSVIRSVNHMGYNITHPENTDIAYMESANQGFQFVETDLQLTRDRVPVCFHDATINRVARNPDGTVLKDRLSIEDLSYREALQYDYGVHRGWDFQGTLLLSFEDFLPICRGYRLSPYIELKPSADWQRSDLQNLIDLVKQYSLEDSVTWISYSEALLSGISALMPESRLGLVVDETNARAVSAAERLRNGRNEVFLDSLTYTADQISLCRRAGIPMEVWPVDSMEKILQLPDYISGVTSNRYVASEVRNQAARE